MIARLRTKNLSGLLRVVFLTFMVALTIASSSVSMMALAGDDDDEPKHTCKKSPNDVPDALKAPADQCLKRQVLGVGVQVYVCTASVWVFKAPEANLNLGNRFVGNHYLGPTWQWRDSSKIKVAPNPVKVAAPNPVNDIPWLLLTVSSHDGSGVLDDVTFVQRLHTFGGQAPAGACAPEASEVRVSYTADYLFYHSKS